MVDLIAPLDKWLEVVRNDDIQKDALVTTTADLVRLLHLDYGTYGHLHGKYFAIRRHLIELSGQFLWDDYTDSNTDEPCDIEWDVHHLQADINPNYVIPSIDDVGPAYVSGTVYPTPDVD